MRKDPLTFEERKELKNALKESPFYNPHKKQPKLTRDLYEKFEQHKKTSVKDLAVYRSGLVKTAFAERFGGIKAPNCFQCKLPVETFSMDYDPKKDEMHFTVECHGAKQLFFRNFEELKDSKAIKIVIPSAFQPKMGTLYEGVFMTKLEWGWETKDQAIKRKNEEFVESAEYDIEKMTHHDFDAIKRSED